jgi:hypothetical protein
MHTQSKDHRVRAAFKTCVPVRTAIASNCRDNVSPGETNLSAQQQSEPPALRRDLPAQRLEITPPARPEPDLLANPGPDPGNPRVQISDVTVQGDHSVGGRIVRSLRLVAMDIHAASSNGQWDNQQTLPDWVLC